MSGAYPVDASGQHLEDEIRRRTRTAVGTLDPVRMANLINGVHDAERTLAFEELAARDEALATLRKEHSAWFDAAERVASAEAAADLKRFRALRKEQRARARGADGPAASLAGALCITGQVLPVAALLAKALDLFGDFVLLALWLLSAVLYLTGRKFQTRRTDPLWNGVFSLPREASRTVWFIAAEAVAAELLCDRERDLAGAAEGLEAVKDAWEARGRRSGLFGSEDYSGLSGVY